MSDPTPRTTSSHLRDALLADRLRCGAGARAWVAGHARRVKAAVEAALVGGERPIEGPVDLAVLTPETLDEAMYFAQKVAPRLTPSGVLIVIWENSTDSPSGGTLDETTLDRLLHDRGFTWFDAFQVAGLCGVRLRPASPDAGRV
ncbi:MAG: hypothetical protein BroJett003_24850 [Planctomycetota bacterium]|nr:MAG: hypothetical protein BroJett003_24850 [Planctomycetota bacterium]